MRTIPSALLTHIQGRNLKLATLWHVEFPYTTKGGASRVGFTNHDQSISVDFHGGTLAYSPKYVVKETSLNTKLNTAIDDTELHLKIDNDVVNWFDIRTKVWHGATIRVGRVNWNSLSDGSYVLAVYQVSNVEASEGILKLELRGFERQFELHRVPRLTLNCQHTFGGLKCGYNLDPVLWQASHSYSLSKSRDHKAKTIVKPSVQNKFWYECTDEGTSGATEPTWPTSIGGTVTDGGVVWTAIHAGRLTGTVTGFSSRTTFAASGINVLADWFAKGRLLWLTGNNATQRMKIYSDDGSGTIVLEEDCYTDIQVGDTFLIDAGCRKRINTDCSTKFDNTYNAWAFPFLVQENAVAKAPRG